MVEDRVLIWPNFGRGKTWQLGKFRLYICFGCTGRYLYIFSKVQVSLYSSWLLFLFLSLDGDTLLSFKALLGTMLPDEASSLGRLSVCLRLCFF